MVGKGNLLFFIFYLYAVQAIPLDSYTLHKSNGRYYKLYHGAKSWWDALARCGMDGSKLAEDVSDDTQKYFATFNKDIWIGGFQEEGKWQWSGRTNVTTQPNWDINQPSTGVRYSCLEFQQNGKWRDTNCSDVKPFLCENFITAKLGDYHLGEDGKYYKLYQTPAAWVIGKMACERDGARLAIVGSNVTHAYLKKAYGVKQMWIGASDQESEGNWVWIDGRPLTNWHLGGKMLDGGIFDGCLSLNYVNRFPGMWDDEFCLTKLPFLCEKGYPDVYTRGKAGKSYKFYKTPVEWRAAYQQCNRDGGSLAVVNSDEIFKDINAHYGDTPIWGGATANTIGVWKWTNGDQLNATLFGGSVPTTDGGQRHCLLINGAERWSWTDGLSLLSEDCTKKHQYICERDDSSPTFESGTDGYAYKYEAAPLKWFDARKRCEEQNSHLAVVIGDETFDYVKNRYGDLSEMWLGATNLYRSNWDWVTGIAAYARYNHWGVNQPSRDGNTCLQMNRFAMGLWSDVPCFTPLPYLCQKALPTGYTKGSDGNSYKLHYEAVTWFQAKKTCKEEGGRLTVMDSSLTQNYLTTTIHHPYLWIGGTDAQEEGVWRWITGNKISERSYNGKSPQISTSRERFTHKHRWKTGRYEDCLIINNKKTGDWNDQRCNKKYAFICQKVHFHDYTVGTDGRQYKLYNILSTWEEAKEKCLQDGARLSVDANVKTDRYLNQMYGTKNFWIGGFVSRSKLYWLNWLEINTLDTYKVWDKSYYRKNCIQMNNTQWQPATCSNKQPFLCQKLSKANYTVGSDGKFYKLYEESSRWKQAKEQCEKDGAHLAILDSEVTFDYVKKEFGFMRTYVGASDKTKEGQWVWVNGEEIKKRDLNFPGSGYKNNGYENCLTINRYGQGTWNDVNCDRRFPFLCQKVPKGLEDKRRETIADWHVYEFHHAQVTWDAAKQQCLKTGAHLVNISSAQANTFLNSYNTDVWVADNCGQFSAGGTTVKKDCAATLSFICESTLSGDYSYGTDGRLYSFVDTPTTWQQAQQHCNKDGAHLATIRYDVTRAYVSKFYGRHEMWIGANDIESENTWQWVTGETVDKLFENFGAGEPNGGRMENCAMVNKYMRGVWNDEACERKLPFLCQKDVFTRNIRLWKF